MNPLLSAGAMGLLSGLGPCAAPRLLALTGLTQGEPGKQAALLCGGFTLGNAITLAAFGCVSSLALRAFDLSPYVYAIVAAILILAGVNALRTHASCDRKHRHVSLGGAVLLGISSASIASPCCTPLLFTVLAMASQHDLSSSMALLLATFAIGSAAPSLLLVALASRIAMRCTQVLLTQLRPLHAGLLIGIGAYYGVLA